MKEVIEKTGLTDRAVRLYMDNELISPEYSKSYNGRRSIEFSENDVEMLNKIVLLRKAGFSLADIKSIEYGGEEARKIVAEYVNKTASEVSRNQKILESLTGLSERENLTMNDICERISDALTESSMPREDLKPTEKEMEEITRYRVLGIGGLILSIYFLIIERWFFKGTFIYTKYYFDRDLLFVFIYSVVIFDCIGALIIVCMNFGKRSKHKFDRRKRRIRAVVSILTTIFIIITPGCIWFSVLVPPVYSETENPRHYLVLDSDIDTYVDGIYRIFPPTIPISARVDTSSSDYPETTKYYYKSEHSIYSSYDIFAEWVLTEKREYEAAKKEVFGNNEDLFPKVTTRGEWKCVYYSDTESIAEQGFTYYMIFAYNDTEQKVRYIISSDQNYSAPYYQKLDW